MNLALVGRHISYSLSPQIHTVWMAHYGLTGTYDLYECHEPDLPGAFEVLDGFNITIPYKKNMIPLVDRLTPFAEAAGAVNTVYKDQGKWIGDNTDVLALLEMIPEAVERILVLGNGGAAQAVKAVGGHRGQEVICVTRQNWDQRHDLTKTVDMVINATPLGLNGQGCPLDYFPDKDLLVVDMVYKPHLTPLLVLAQQKGLKTMGGLEMLIRQARHSFHRWWGILPDYEVARSSI